MISRLVVLSAVLVAFGCERAGKADSSAAKADTSAQAPAPPVVVGETTGLGGATTGVAAAPRGVGGLRAGAPRSTRRPPPTTTGGAASAPPPASRTPPASGRTAAARGQRRDTTPAPAPTSTERGDSAVTRSAAADTARGIVAVVGTSADSRVILRPTRGGRTITLIGPESRTVGRLGGADVWVNGTRDEYGQLRVSRFVVRSVDGNKALDGTLIARGERLIIVTRDGEQHAIDAAPPGLREHVGARVWVTGPLARGPIVYGVIEERR